MTVNCIAPGLIEDARMAQRLPAEIVQLARSQVVLGRVASVQDIAAQVVTFYRVELVTGQVLVIDGVMPECMHWAEPVWALPAITEARRGSVIGCEAIVRLDTPEPWQWPCAT